jgi:hypothetical protein
MRSAHIRFTTVAMIALLAATLAACSSDTSSSAAASPSSSGTSLDQAKASVCGKLTDASSAVSAAQASPTGETSSNVQTLAGDMSSAAFLLQSLGVDAAKDLKKLSTDLQNLATAAPGAAATAAGSIQTEISNLESTLACPEASATP